MSALIKLDNICKTYGEGETAVHALKNISLTVEQGEFVAIMGHSGSGKSTMLNILGCLDRPSTGIYTLDGIDVSEMVGDELSDIRNKKIGFVFQSFNLIPRTSALRNVELPMVYGKKPGKVRLERARMLLEKVGLGERLDHMPNELSGGQKQRVAVARSLANEPPIILADEPTGNLDSTSTVEIMELFTQLNKEGVTVLIVTHEIDVAAFTKRVLWFEDGQLLRDERKDVKC